MFHDLDRSIERFGYGHLDPSLELARVTTVTAGSTALLSNFNTTSARMYCR